MPTPPSIKDETSRVSDLEEHLRQSQQLLEQQLRKKDSNEEVLLQAVVQQLQFLVVGMVGFVVCSLAVLYWLLSRRIDQRIETSDSLL